MTSTHDGEQSGHSRDGRRGMLAADNLSRFDRPDGQVFAPRSTALFTDLYHVDAAYVSWLNEHNGRSTFDLYTRSAPFGGAYMLVAGLGPALDYIRNFSYSDDDLAYLERVKGYKPAFLDYLGALQFSGDIEAVPEGEILFPNEPFLRVTAPFPEALLLESGLLRAIGVSTLIATKAARLAQAAQGRPVSDFAFRRAHDPHLAARSGFIGGCASTSFVAAAKEYDMPAAGTIPHALVQSFRDELTAFRAVATSLPKYSLLLDTYDVRRGTSNAIIAAREGFESHGHTLAAVRLDSGDLAADSLIVRDMLDEAGLNEVRVLVSGDIDEYKIARFVAAGAPIDGFGVGGNLGVGLGTIESGTVGGVIGAIYKLAWYESDDADPARIKLAGEKSTWPGRKTAWRIGAYERDVVQLEEEDPPAGGRQLATSWIARGHLVAQEPSLHEVRDRAACSLAAMPANLKELTAHEPYRVDVSLRLSALRKATIEGLRLNNRAQL